jgi:hypothetical protein
LVIGTGGDDREGSVENAEVRVYQRVGTSYSLDGSVIDPGRFRHMESQLEMLMMTNKMRLL